LRKRVVNKNQGMTCKSSGLASHFVILFYGEKNKDRINETLRNWDKSEGDRTRREEDSQ